MIDHGSPEWYAARCGRPTGSEMWRIMARKKNGEPTAERDSYVVEKLTERLTGSVTRHSTTADMQWGIDMEPTALNHYEVAQSTIIERGHWIDCGTWGCTPDAFVGSDGLVSIKCPRTTTVVRMRFCGDPFPPQYYWQMMAEMAATGRQWCDLAIFDNRFANPDLHLWVTRFPRDDDAIGELLTEIDKFVAELDAAELS